LKNIVLIGFMGSGKTTVGKKVSRITGMKFVDLDAQIEKSAKTKISRIFETRGELYFRGLETKALAKAGKKSKTVISTGGGIIKMDKNLPLLKKAGLVVYLKNSFAVCKKRLEGKTDRPLFNKDNLKSARALFKSRLELYKKAADITVITDRLNAEEAAKLIVTKAEKIWNR